MKNQMFCKNSLMVPIILMGVLLFFSLSGFETISAQEEEKPCPKPYIKTLSPKAAKVGDEIKIRGSRFGKEQGGVTFAPGVRAPIQEWTFKKIFVIVPEGAITGPVFVKTHCGEMSNEDYFTIKTAEE
jgi:hypothetical protein